MVGTSPAGMFMASHLQESHPDYLAWKKGKFRPSLAAGVALGLTLDFLLAFVLYNYGVHLPRDRAGGWPFLVVLFAALPIPRLLLDRRGYRRFRREWNERGSFPASNLPLEEG